MKRYTCIMLFFLEKISEKCVLYIYLSYTNISEGKKLCLN